MEAITARKLVEEPRWPDADGRPIVFLVDASSTLERRLLHTWIDRSQPSGLGPGAVQRVALPRSRRRPQGESAVDPRLQILLLDDDAYDPLLVPLRIAWLAPKRDGRRQVRPSDLLRLGDPRDPDWLRQHWILRQHPDRCRIVMGAPAPASELRNRWRETTLAGSDDDAGLPAFVSLQGHLALEQAERRLKGNRYKVPRFIRPDLTTRRAFQVGLRRLASETQWPAERIQLKAPKYLKEIAASHSPYVIDLVAHFTRFLIRKSYGTTVDYDPERLAEVYAFGDRYPLIFLPTHKSYIDTLILQQVLYENDYPPNHTAGGKNMNFWPVGPLLRRSGVFFIRRSFKDNPVYKFVLRHYIRYLIEKRFPLEWYIEGGRSRTGKLREPRYGMCGYVREAYESGAAEDIMLVPVSIAYDQLHEVRDYVAEQRGRSKRTESFRTLVDYVRASRRRHGSIYLRVGQPVSLRQVTGEPDPTSTQDERMLATQKLAFEVSFRINEITPVTRISLVTLALLANKDRAVTATEMSLALAPYCHFITERGLPTTEPLGLASRERVAAVLDELVEHRVVARYTEGPETVYAIGEGQHLAAAYYRNTIVHFFVEAAFVELALLAAAESGEPVAAFWEETRRLRDLFKFEFFYPQRGEFRQRLDAEATAGASSWAEMAHSRQALTALRSRPLLTAHMVLRPFVEAYTVVADTLAGRDQSSSFEEDDVLADAMAMSRQRLLQRRLQHPESASFELFRTALRLANNRGLLEPGADEGRKGLADEVTGLLHRIEAIEALASAASR